MEERLNFEREDAVSTIKLNDGTQIRGKFIVTEVLYDSKTKHYRFNIQMVQQFIKNPGDLNLEVKK